MKERFFTAGRRVPLVPSAVSIAASWVWAPALFVSAEVSYKWGWQGLAWFLIPNVAVLIIFGFFAQRVRDRLPQGFTLSGFMRETYSRRVQRAYLGQLSALALCSFAVQMVAGGAVIAFITGWNYGLITVLMAAAALTYSSLGGLRASIAADFFHIGTTIAVVVTFAPAVLGAVGADTIAAGMSSSGVDAWAVALSFGIPTAIGLISGPFGDQSFWQRTFATRARQVRNAFTLSAFIFAIVPLSMAVLGFAAAGAGLVPDSEQLVNVETVYALLPTWTVIPFTIMVVGALVSTMDNNLVSVSTLTGHDLTTTGHPINRGRVVMAATAILATAIANVPGITVTHLFLIYGTLRASTLAPTVLTLTLKRRLPSEPGMFWGIILALLIGLPVFLYGSFAEGADAYKTVGSILTIGIAATTVLISRQKGQDHARV